MEEFKKFSKIPRLSRDCIITEKIDGTNAQIMVTEDGQVLAGCRTRWITPGKNTDNFGFAAWVETNKEELKQLGVGRHYGEWCGQGIQRNYGLKEKWFVLFNEPKHGERPACIGLVPVLYTGPFCTVTIQNVLNKLVDNGSSLVPGFINPEGVIIYHAASGQRFKKTIANDTEYKGVKNETTK